MATRRSSLLRAGPCFPCSPDECAGGRSWTVGHRGDPCSRACSGQLRPAAAPWCSIPGRGGAHDRSSGGCAPVCSIAWPAAVAALGLLLFEFNGTQMMLAATPLGNACTYKHFGVVDYMVHGGALSDPLDVYQQWPGFFAAAAALVRLSGRSPLAYSNWAQLFFEMLNAVVIFAIARRFSQGHQESLTSQFCFSKQLTGKVSFTTRRRQWRSCWRCCSSSSSCRCSNQRDCDGHSGVDHG